MTAEEKIRLIKSRILSEHRKYAHIKEMDWAELAARKIIASLQLREDGN